MRSGTFFSELPSRLFPLETSSTLPSGKRFELKAAWKKPSPHRSCSLQGQSPDDSSVAKARLGAGAPL